MADRYETEIGMSAVYLVRPRDPKGMGRDVPVYAKRMKNAAGFGVRNGHGDDLISRMGKYIYYMVFSWRDLVRFGWAMWKVLRWQA